MSRPVITRLAGLPVVVLVFAVGCDRTPPPSHDASPAAPVTQSSTAPTRPDKASSTGDSTSTGASAAGLRRIVFLGDSLTAGLGIGKDQAVPALIQERLRREGFTYEVGNAGNSDDTSDGGLTRLDWSLGGHVAILVIELGANDGLRGLPPARMRQNLESIVETARQRGIAVLLTGMEAPPNYGPAYTAEFRQTFRDVATHEKVAFMPFFLEDVAGIPRLNQADGIHPTPEGARIVADNLWRYLEPLLKKSES